MYDTIIIGAGIAGLSAAIYASRKRMKYEIISSDFGGQFNNSGEVLNYPGIVKTTGPDFNKILKEQSDFNKIKPIYETVKKIKKKGNNYEVATDKNYYPTQTIIIATGARPKKLGIKGEDEYLNKGVSYCSICDGPLFVDKTVAIIGGGNSALESVDFLGEIAFKINLIVGGNSFDAHEYLVEKVINNPYVDIYFNTEVEEIIGNDFVKGINIKQKQTKATLDVDGIFVDIGHVPNTEIFKDLVELDEHKHILIDCQTKSSLPGIYAAGDCASGHEYQYVIAAGQGCMALIKAARYIFNKNNN